MLLLPEVAEVEEQARVMRAFLLLLLLARPISVVVVVGPTRPILGQPEVRALSFSVIKPAHLRLLVVPLQVAAEIRFTRSHQPVHLHLL